MSLSLSLSRGIKIISQSNDVPESWSKKQVKQMQEYRQQGAKFGDTIDGYRKWIDCQRKCIK